eukprot:5814945-Pyramimonas_sp.AAC.1
MLHKRMRKRKGKTAARVIDLGRGLGGAPRALGVILERSLRPLGACWKPSWRPSWRIGGRL